jgi:uncharacterized membrane protein YhaH (DUF805 family)
MSALKSLFTLDGRVRRAQYLAAGFGLGIFKYVIDAGLRLAVTGEFWEPLDYLDPRASHRLGDVDAFPTVLIVWLIVWTLPFVWVGVVMSARRARDAGRSPWWGLAFLVPVVHFLVIAVLAVLPTRESETKPWKRDDFTFRVAICGVAATTLLVMGMVVLMTEGMDYYGVGLFFTAPFLLGAGAAFMLNLPKDFGLARTLGVVALTLCVGFIALLGFALEGVVCLVMALPIALPTALLGAAFGYFLARKSVAPDAQLGIVILLLPVGAGLELQLFGAGEREVVTTIDIGASPERIWEHVVSFSDLPEPEHWLFETGIAYPLRARIEGEGVGAVRHCEFSTGAFVEPITVWDVPRRLSFDVREQPIPMEEWSFYESVRPPHLEDAFRSVRGEFRLIALTDGGTRLEGSTWYVMDMGPAPYWQLWGDAIVHRIHERVLAHVKLLAEV